MKNAAILTVVLLLVAGVLLAILLGGSSCDGPCHQHPRTNGHGSACLSTSLRTVQHVLLRSSSV